MVICQFFYCFKVDLYFFQILHFISLAHFYLKMHDRYYIYIYGDEIVNPFHYIKKKKEIKFYYATQKSKCSICKISIKYSLQFYFHTLKNSHSVQSQIPFFPPPLLLFTRVLDDRSPGGTLTSTISRARFTRAPSTMLFIQFHPF